MKKLSIIIPVYNEEKMVGAAIRRVLKTKVVRMSCEVIVVNDGSTDNTGKLLRSIKDKRLVLLQHKKNQGKGAAIKTALKRATGDVMVIQDADLEYDPADLNILLLPILDGRADVVFGSRFVGSQPHRVLYFWHRVANQMITSICNLATNINLTDIETGYKSFTSEVAKRIVLKENRFGFDPEFTVKVAQGRFRIYEVGVSYTGRSYEEGKKISMLDGVVAIWAIVKYSLIK